MGLTPGRGIDMFTAVYPAFHQQYPDITVEPREMSVRSQQHEIAQGRLDIGFMTLRESDRTGDVYQVIGREEFVLAIPEDHPLGAMAAPAGKPLAVMDLARLKYEPFVFMYRESTSRRLTDAVFKEAGFAPSVLFETSSTATIANLVRSRICCGLIPLYYVQRQPEGIAAFALDSHPAWDIAVSWRQGGYVSQAAREFIRLAAAYWTNTPE